MTIAPRLREDRSGSAATDAGQGDQGIDVAWQCAVEAFDAVLRGGMQVACAGVIAKAGPQREHVVQRCRGKRRDVRQGRHEAFEVGHDDADLRLLQHDFRQPHAVRRARMLPGQVVAAIAIEPVQQPRSESVRHQRPSPGWRWSGGELRIVERDVDAVQFHAGDVEARRLESPVEWRQRNRIVRADPIGRFRLDGSVRRRLRRRVAVQAPQQRTDPEVPCIEDGTAAERAIARVVAAIPASLSASARSAPARVISSASSSAIFPDAPSVGSTPDARTAMAAGSRRIPRPNRNVPAMPVTNGAWIAPAS